MYIIYLLSAVAEQENRCFKSHPLLNWVCYHGWNIVLSKKHLGSIITPLEGDLNCNKLSHCIWGMCRPICLNPALKHWRDSWPNNL